MSRYAAALDFGSAKVALAVGEKTDAGVRIVSYHDAPSAGIESGEIVNDFKVEEVVRALVEQARADLPEEITEVSFGLSGRVLHSKEFPIQITRRNPDSYILEDEVRQITRARYKANLEGDEVVFEAVPQKYSTEDRIGITHEELIGMVGGQIDADFKIFFGRKGLRDRRVNIIEKCGLTPRKAILAPIASARAVLSRPEMENGVALVDIGKGSTEVAIVKDNIVRHVAIIPFGGESVTGDIKNVANITREWAETVKLRHGRCCEEYAVENKKLVLKSENETVEGEIEMSLLIRTVEARLSEILDAVRYVIEQSGYAGRIASGVVITGGASHHEDLLQLASALLGQKVRLAAPQGAIDNGSVEDAYDVYASTAVGLVLETLDPMLSHALDLNDKPEQNAQQSESGRNVETLFDEVTEPEERPLSKRERKEEERRAREEERRAKEARKQAAREAREKEKKGPSFIDMLFSDNNNA
jgi:cell division protein FtsA